MAIHLSDLPPKYRAQALQQLARQSQQQPAEVEGHTFDSKGESDFYMGTVLPALRSGRLLECKLHQAFELFPPGEYHGEKLRPIRYTPDFQLFWADGSVEIVEIKSKFVRKMQRDYHIRRRIFLEKYAIPNGWHFREVITCDTTEDINQWRASHPSGGSPTKRTMR